MKNMNLITTVVGVVLSLALVITGICFLTSDPGYYGTTVPTSYTFGADFYTETYGAIRDVATNTSTTARNARELNEIVTAAVGWAFMFAGLFSLVNNGSKLVGALDEMGVFVNKDVQAVEEVFAAKAEQVAQQTAEQTETEA